MKDSRTASGITPGSPPLPTCWKLWTNWSRTRRSFHDGEFDEKSGIHTNCGWCMARIAIAKAKGGAA